MSAALKDDILFFMDWIALFSDYGYLLLFFVLLVEGQPFLIFAGFLVSLKIMEFDKVLLVGWPALALGDYIFFLAAKQWGRKMINRCGRFLFVKESTIIKLENFFQKHDAKAIVISKFIYGLGRNLLMVAGLLGRSYKKMLKYELVSSAAAFIFFVGLGYFLGHSYLLLNKLLKGVGFVVIAAIIVLFIFERWKLWRYLEKLINLFYCSHKNNDRPK